MKNKKTFSSIIANWRDVSLTEFKRAWGGIKNFTQRTFSGKPNPDLTSKEEAVLREKIRECLKSAGGCSASVAHAVDVGTIYLDLSAEGQKKFLKMIAEEFDTEQESIRRHAEKYMAAKTENELIAAELLLKESLIPLRMELLKKFSSLPSGFKFLIDLRADLLPLKKEGLRLSKLENELKELLASWFDVGLLDLQEITWSSPASLLEKLIKYEAVHAISSWQDLKDRLDSDRRCFAFFHNKIPMEPLIFVEVALVDKLADNIQNVLDQSTATLNVNDANTAIFYSISNTQKGLAGINLGNFLIKQVAERLSLELPNIKQFATLSPIPGFRGWLEKKLSAADSDSSKILEPLQKEIKAVLPDGKCTSKGLLEFISLPEYARLKSDEMEAILKHLCAYYLLVEKKGGRAIDPVANFHLTNGARAERLNYMADSSPKGLKESYGMMVNYLYRLPDIEANNETYLSTGKIVSSKGFRSCLRQ